MARARRIQAELDALTGRRRLDATDEIAGHVRLGMIGTTARWLVPLLCSAVRSAHPQVHLVIVDATTTSLVPQLHDRAARPGRREPPRRRSRRGDPERCSTRTTS